MRANRPTDPREKALAVNLDPRRYGTFAEIGAGQEVVRWFFRVGGAAGTISKSISAYDMTVSDAIYGSCARYVCRERLQAMLDYEHDLTLRRLREKRGDSTAFFAFADTVAARSFRGNDECHGWMGVKFQAHPRDQDSQIVIHVRMRDGENALQQEALGIVGVNLVYGACFLSHEPEELIESLLDGLSTDRIEIDMIEFAGIEFRHVDNRVMSLRLVQLGLSAGAMFGASGDVLQPAEVLHKRPVLVERGSFRPVTHVNLDMLDCARRKFELREGVEPGETVTLMEITLSNILADGQVDLHDFFGRADVLAATGQTVLISDCTAYHRLVAYLARYTARPIGIALGAGSLLELFEERTYEPLEGSMLESFGRLFKRDCRFYVYPLLDPDTGTLLGVENLPVQEPLNQLYRYLVADGRIESLDDFQAGFLHIFSRDVLQRIQAGDDSWEEMVPKEVARVIRERGFFGLRSDMDRG